jgi:hypothetical protein
MPCGTSLASCSSAHLLHAYAPNEFHVCTKDDMMPYEQVWMMRYECDEHCNIISTKDQAIWCSIQITLSLGAKLLSGINMLNIPYTNIKHHQVQT